MRSRSALVLVTMALFGYGASAEECVPTVSNADLEAAGYYYVNDSCDPNCYFSVWVYEEMNGIPGLQRADEVHDDTCGGLIPGDRVIF